MDCSLPGFYVHGLLQARVVEWVAMPSSRGIFPTLGSNLRLLHFLHWQMGYLQLAPPGKPPITQNTWFKPVDPEQKDMYL